MKLEQTVAEIAALVGGRVVGSPDRRLAALRSLELAGPDDLAAVFRAELFPVAEAGAAGCLIVSEDAALEAGDVRSLVAVSDPEAAVDRITAELGPPEPDPPPGRHPTAVVEDGARVDDGACLGAHVFVGRGARVGPRSRLWPGVFVGEDAVVGSDCRLFPGVYVGARCELGDRVLLHPGVVVGADGFGYRWAAPGHHAKSPQVGRVVLEDDVEIGANATVDRARLEVTRIGRGVKLDAQVHIGHNVTVGEHCAFAAQTTLAGRAKVGRRVLMGGMVGVYGGVEVGDDAKLGTFTLVLKDVASGEYQVGIPAVSHGQWKRQILSLSRLPGMMADLRASARKGEAGGP